MTRLSVARLLLPASENVGEDFLKRRCIQWQGVIAEDVSEDRLVLINSIGKPRFVKPSLNLKHIVNHDMSVTQIEEHCQHVLKYNRQIIMCTTASKLDDCNQHTANCMQR